MTLHPSRIDVRAKWQKSFTTKVESLDPYSPDATWTIDLGADGDNFGTIFLTEDQLLDLLAQGIAAVTRQPVPGGVALVKAGLRMWVDMDHIPNPKPLTAEPGPADRSRDPLEQADLDMLETGYAGLSASGAPTPLETITKPDDEHSGGWAATVQAPVGRD